MGELIAQPWMREVLDDPHGLIATSGTVTMPLQFYAEGPVFIGIISNRALDDLAADVFDHMADGYRVLFLFDAARHAKAARKGLLSDATIADLAALRERLMEIDAPLTWNGIEVFELTEWAARGGR